MNPPRYTYGIIGWPLGHSLSPVLQAWAMERAGHAGVFQVWPVLPEDLAAFVRRVRQEPVQGLAVTIPHKVAVMPLLDGLTEEAQAVGAVNTLFWRDGALWGHTTDVAGFVAGWRGFYAALGTAPASALVLGAGGAARAVLQGLRGLGVKDIRLTARNALAGAELAADFGAAFTPWEHKAGQPAQAVINSTPLGMAGSAGQGESPLSAADFTALGRGFAPEERLAYDLVYNPLDTPFLRLAASGNWAVQAGLVMLAAQGLAQFELWSGLAAPALAEAVEILKSALLTRQT